MISASHFVRSTLAFRRNPGASPTELKEFQDAQLRRLNVAQREAGFPEIQAFVSGMIETEARTFRELRDGWDDRLFCPETGSGLVPYVPGLLPGGKCGVVALAGSREEAEALYQQAGTAVQTA
jgi:hypothetical protein